MRSSLWHRLDVYFGVIPEDESAREMREQRSSTSPREKLLTGLATAAIAGVLFGVVEDNLWSGLSFAAILAAGYAVLPLWRRRRR